MSKACDRIAFASSLFPRCVPLSVSSNSKSLSTRPGNLPRKQEGIRLSRYVDHRPRHTSTPAVTMESQSVSAYEDIVRKDPNDRFSKIVIHNDIVYLSGIIAPSPERDVVSQTRIILEQLDDLLVEAGTHKSRILTSTVWLADISRVDDMNKAWNEWLDVENKPARACVEGKLALDDAVVEVQATAALPSRARILRTVDAASAVGPYNQGVVIENGTVYISGCIGLSATSGAMVGDSVEEQCAQALSNLKAILKEAGCGPQDIVKTMILLEDMKDFATVNDIYANFFEGGPVPARSCFAAKQLPKGALVEIEAIAILKRV